MHAEDREWQRQGIEAEQGAGLPHVRTTRYLAIDPGNVDSAYVVVDGDRRRPLEFGKLPNQELLDHLADLEIDRAVIEMVASYGMAVGAEVFDTCVWIGRYQLRLEDFSVPTQLVKRLPVKIHLCHNAAAKDSNIRQALVDRFAPGVSNYGKGTKDAPGWFYRFSADVWAAYALGVYAADNEL